ncbi:MAG: UDP-N-acetylmuramoyl-L-alanyl-D-glutamate--2,6-diaminopimelate ligase [Steroidobacteraceae bacterium]
MKRVADDRNAGYRTTLAALLEGIAVPMRDVAVAGLAMDSRDAGPDGVFLACAGRTSHGIAHAADAIARGATVVLHEPADGVAVPALPPQVIVHAIPGLRSRVGEIADRYFRSPSAALEVAACTGTNGKTTVTWLLAQAADLLGRRGAYLGTLGYGRLGSVSGAGLTTPDCVSVHRRLAEARDAGARTVAMEVSSHALDQGRIDAVRVDTAVFTNLTRDHLDYHGTLEAYAEAKARLFRVPGLVRAVVNVRDPYGRRLAESLDPSIEHVYYSTSNDVWAPQGSGWLRVPQLRATSAGLTLAIESSWGAGTLRSRLVGEFNAENLLAVLAVLLGWRVPLQRALAALEPCVAPPGRMEAFGGGAQPLVLVDYAHTPDALAKVLLAARAHARGRVHCVFGCGGDRDPGKRPLMGAIAEDHADVVVVTDDNPRTEDSRVIIEQVLAGMREPSAAHVIADRTEAIQHAIAEADAGDVIVVAGKGHEDYQVVGREVRPYSDRTVVRDSLGREG